MQKIKVAEIFYSLQGEGKWAGVPSVFLRSFGCNFECRGFGMPAGEHTDNPEQIAKDVDKFNKYEDLPLTEFGCDVMLVGTKTLKSLALLWKLQTLLTRCKI